MTKERYKELRRKLGLSILDVADRLGKHTNTILYYERMGTNELYGLYLKSLVENERLKEILNDA